MLRSIKTGRARTAGELEGRLEGDAAWRVAQQESEVDVHDATCRGAWAHVTLAHPHHGYGCVRAPTVRPDEDVAVVSVFDLQEVADDGVRGHALDEAARHRLPPRA